MSPRFAGTKRPRHIASASLCRVRSPLSSQGQGAGGEVSPLHEGGFRCVQPVRGQVAALVLVLPDVLVAQGGPRDAEAGGATDTRVVELARFDLLDVDCEL